MNNKSKLAAALLAFFLGGLGIHRYYLGYTKKGLVQTIGFLAFLAGYVLLFGAVMAEIFALLLLGVVLFIFGIGTSIWAFIDFIRILLGSLAPADGSDYIG